MHIIKLIGSMYCGCNIETCQSSNEHQTAGAQTVLHCFKFQISYCCFSYIKHDTWCFYIEVIRGNLGLRINSLSPFLSSVVEIGTNDMIILFYYFPKFCCPDHWLLKFFCFTCSLLSYTVPLSLNLWNTYLNRHICRISIQGNSFYYTC